MVFLWAHHALNNVPNKSDDISVHWSGPQVYSYGSYLNKYYNGIKNLYR